MPPRPSAASPIADWQDSVLVTSHEIANVPSPASLAAPSSRSCRRANSAVLAPRFASPIPMQRPSPLDAPMTTVRNLSPPVELTAMLDKFVLERPGSRPHRLSNDAAVRRRSADWAGRVTRRAAAPLGAGLQRCHLVGSSETAPPWGVRGDAGPNRSPDRDIRALQDRCNTRAAAFEMHKKTVSRPGPRTLLYPGRFLTNCSRDTSDVPDTSLTALSSEPGLRARRQGWR
jgi:hypothetical protein